MVALSLSCMLMFILSLWGVGGLAVGLLVAVQVPLSWPTAMTVLVASAALGYGVDCAMFESRRKEVAHADENEDGVAAESTSKSRSSSSSSSSSSGGSDSSNYTRIDPGLRAAQRFPSRRLFTQ